MDSFMAVSVLDWSRTARGKEAPAMDSFAAATTTPAVDSFAVADVSPYQPLALPSTSFPTRDVTHSFHRTRPCQT